MADRLLSMDPNMRQQLAAMLTGDAKAGSIRADLVRGLLGSSTGDDQGLVGMTPMGAVFNAEAAHRDQMHGRSGLENTLSAAAGLIPGAGPEGKVLAEEAVAPLVKRLAQEHNLGDLLGAHSIERIPASPGNENELDGMTVHIPFTRQPTPAETASVNHLVDRLQSNEGDIADHVVEGRPYLLGDGDDTMGATNHGNGISFWLRHWPEYKGGGNWEFPEDEAGGGSVREELEKASKNDDKGATAVSAAKPSTPTPAGQTQANAKSTTPQPVTPRAALHEAAGTNKGIEVNDSTLESHFTPEEDSHIRQVAGGDVKKENFIRQAMQDEGGNVPEDVADLLADHAHQKGVLQDMLDRHDIHTRGEEGKLDLANEMVERYSIPEMLSMHYDLDPETMGRAYDMPTNPSRGMKPTQ